MERSLHITEGVAKHAKTSSVQEKCVRWGSTIDWPLHWPHMYTWPLWLLAADVCVEWQAAISTILSEKPEERVKTERRQFIVSAVMASLTSLSQSWSELGSAGCSCCRCPVVRMCWHPKHKAAPRLLVPWSGHSLTQSGGGKKTSKTSKVYFILNTNDKELLSIHRNNWWTSGWSINKWISLSTEKRLKSILIIHVPQTCRFSNVAPFYIIN